MPAGLSGGELALEVPPAFVAPLLARTAPDGFLPFDRFQEVALYAEGIGYYARAKSPFGPEGDYYTAPRVDPLYARTLAARCREALEGCDREFPARLVELGCGDGTLLGGVVAELRRTDGARDLEAVAVDRSAARRRQARERVSAVSDVRVTEAASLAGLGPFRGVVIAHELLDATPVRRFRREAEGYAEEGFRWEGDLLHGTTRPLPPGDRLASRLPGPEATAPGDSVEVAPGTEGVVREVADHLVAGLLVVVDYGELGPELRAGHRGGTVNALRGHRSLPLSEIRLGETDLSSFVDFSAVRAAAARSGLAEVAYRRQAEALTAWGLPTLLERAVAEAPGAEGQVRLRLAAKSLLFGFETFRVLELAPPADAERLRRLSGP